MQLTVASAIFGFFYGLLQKVPEARDHYLTENQQTRYLSTYEAGVQIISKIYFRVSYFKSNFNIHFYHTEKNE